MFVSQTATVNGTISVGDVAYFSDAGTRQAGEVLLPAKVNKMEYTIISVWDSVAVGGARGIFLL